MDGDPAISQTDAEQLAQRQVACLEDGGCAEGREATDEPRVEATTETSQTAPRKPTAESGTVPTEVTVSITSAGFDPNPVVIAVGDTVTWVNDDPEAVHGITLLSEAGFVDASDTLEPGRSYSYTFTEAGTYPYVEVFDPTMQGTVIVE